MNDRTIHRPRRLLKTILAAIVLIVAAAAYMLVEALNVQLIHAQVELENLPAAFEGTKILFVSDIHLDFYQSPQRAYELIANWCAEEPDLILFGGDYTSFGLDLQLGMRAGGKALADLRKTEIARRDEFFTLIGQIDAPLGKYGIAGNHDNALDSKKSALAKSMKLGGVKLLRNEGAWLKRDGAQLALWGTEDWETGGQRLGNMASKLSKAKCAIILNHNPDAMPSIIKARDKQGKRWSGIVVSGHTHGGQVRPFGVALVSSSRYGERYRTGMIEEGGLKLLVTNGMGTLYLPLRMGAPAQAHLITLVRADE